MTNILPNNFHITLTELTILLQQRMTVIQDHTWRDRDARSHLEALQEVSEKISSWTSTHRTKVDAQLRHYLANSSFEKALAHAEALIVSPRQD